MMKWKIVLAALLFITMSLGTHAENLFVSLLGKSEKEVNERIEKIWEHFFTPADLSCYEAGDEKSVYYKGPDGTAFILDTGNNDHGDRRQQPATVPGVGGCGLKGDRPQRRCVGEQGTEARS